MSLYLGENCISAGGSSAFKNNNIGEIIQSTIPLTDAGLHLLDGSLISGSGAYSAFVTYIAGLVSNYPDLFETEANWQQSVTNYGVCGKFVYDSVNNTVRLPLIEGFTESTIDTTVVGDLTEAGLPNITGELTGATGIEYGSGSGAITEITGNVLTHSGTQTGRTNGFTFDASNSSSIYKDSFNKVQPQSIKVLYYIVVATSTKTDIQVDIDEIATDLNGKADVDLSNLTSTGQNVIDGQWVSSTLVLENGTIITTTTSTGQDFSYDLSNYLPNDGREYEILLNVELNGNTNLGFYIIYAGVTDGTGATMCKNYNSVGICVMAGNSIIPLKTNRTLYISLVNTGQATLWWSVLGYRRIGTNS